MPRIRLALCSLDRRYSGPTQVGSTNCQAVPSLYVLKASRATAGALFWEQPGHHRKRRKKGDTTMDTWKNCGGKKPVTVLQDPTRQGPAIERRVGRIIRELSSRLNQPTLRYHQYYIPLSTETDSRSARRDMWEHRSHLYHVLEESSGKMSQRFARMRQGATETESNGRETRTPSQLPGHGVRKHHSHAFHMEPTKNYDNPSRSLSGTKLGE